MRNKIVTNIVIICLFILINSSGVIGAEAAGFKPVESDRIPEILTLISERIKSNYERIKTWQGEGSIRESYIYEGPRAEKVFKADTIGEGEIPSKIKKHIDAYVEFSIDVEKDFMYVNFNSNSPKPLQYMDFETKRDLGAKRTLDLRRTIRTPEYQIDCSGHRRRRGVVIEQRAVKQARPMNDLMCDVEIIPVYDPMKTCKAFKDEIWELFPQLTEIIMERGKYSIDDFDLTIEERKFGGITEYRIKLPSKAGTPENFLYLSSNMVFSSDKGFNIISYQYVDQNGIQLRNQAWDYDNVDGVYVPINVTQKDFNWPEGSLSSEKIVSFKNLHVNHVIPPGTFEYTNLGLKDGDVFVDEIMDKEYRYEVATKQLKPVEK